MTQVIWLLIVAGAGYSVGRIGSRKAMFLKTLDWLMERGVVYRDRDEMMVSLGMVRDATDTVTEDRIRSYVRKTLGVDDGEE